MENWIDEVLDEVIDRTKTEYDISTKDAIKDWVIFLCHYARKHNLDAQTILDNALIGFFEEVDEEEDSE